VALLKRKQVAATEPAVAERATIPIADARPRDRVCVSGKVTRMTARPTAGQPALCVAISDDSGTISAVWTGRRAIGGVTLGRRVLIDGVSVRRGAQLEFTNPRYTLLPR
jgi:RecG-like helicase